MAPTFDTSPCTKCSCLGFHAIPEHCVAALKQDRNRLQRELDRLQAGVNTADLDRLQREKAALHDQWREKHKEWKMNRGRLERERELAHAAYLLAKGRANKLQREVERMRERETELLGLLREKFQRPVNPPLLAAVDEALAASEREEGAFNAKAWQEANENTYSCRGNVPHKGRTAAMACWEHPPTSERDEGEPLKSCSCDNTHRRGPCEVHDPTLAAERKGE